MTIKSFFTNFPRFLSFGVLHYFFSGFGQTFLISIFVPHFIETFNFSNTYFGNLYSAATVLSALTLPWAGTLIDKLRLRTISLINGALLIFFCLIGSFAINPFILLIALFGLRFTGQGGMVVIGSTAMARYFSQVRGKAVALSSLGLSLSEAILPTAITAAIAFVTWQGALQLSALSVVLVFIPLTILLVKKNDPFQLPPEEEQTNNEENEDETKTEKSYTRKDVLRDPRFYLIVPVFMFLPFFITGMFIHQNLVAEAKGWTMEWMAFSFTGFGASRILTYFLAGPLIDRFSARRVFIVYLVPLFFGILVLLLFDHRLAAFGYLFLTGMTASLGSVTGVSIWAELYGVRYLGSIKSMTTMLMVLATALGPVVLGYLLEGTDLLPPVLLSCAGLIALLVSTAWLTLEKK